MNSDNLLAAFGCLFVFGALTFTGALILGGALAVAKSFDPAVPQWGVAVSLVMAVVGFVGVLLVDWWRSR